MRAVLVTGASQGIGAAAALRLDALGFRVFAGVRSEPDGHALRRKGSPSLTPVTLDVTKPQTIKSAVETLEAGGPYGFVGLVNNAAISAPCPLEFVPLDEVRAEFEVNLFGTLAVTQAMLPVVRDAGAGRVVNVSSINGRLAQRYIGVYSASKFALEGMSDALRRELRRWGIHVVVVQPGAVETRIFQTVRERGRIIAERLPPAARALYGGLVNGLVRAQPAKIPPQAVAPERAARTITRALTARRPRTRYAVGWDARVGLLLHRLLPDRLEDLLLGR